MKANDDFKRVREAADLKQFAAEHLHSIRGKGLVCPACDSGTGPNGTPAFSIMPDGRRWKCFACGESGDVFDLAGIVNGCEDNRHEQLKAVAEWAGVRLDNDGGQGKTSGNTGTGETPNGSSGKEGGKEKGNGGNGKKGAGKERRIPLYRVEREAREREEAVKTARERSEAYVRECMVRISDPEAARYLAERGISGEMAARFTLGYDPGRKRLVIPYPGALWYHTARDITGCADPKYLIPSTKKIGEAPLWNADALKADVLFVVEGQLDAMAVAECGGWCVCTGGNKELDRVAGALAGYNGFAYLLFDTDKAGRDECDRLLMKLEDAGAYSPGRVGVMDCPYPDPWDWFRSDPDDMREAITKAVGDAPNEADRLSAFARSFEPDGGDEAEWLACPEVLATGLVDLDRVLGGGLAPGVTVLAAPPGAGKSSLAIQIAANVAARGTGVLFISAEMPRRDVIARLAAYTSYASNEKIEPFTYSEFKLKGAKLLDDAGGFGDAALENAKGTPYGKALGAMRTVFLGSLAVCDGRNSELTNVQGVDSLIDRAASAGVQLVVIDYLQFIDAGGTGVTDKAERDGYVARVLTEAAKRTGTVVLALSSVTKAEGARSEGQATAFAAKGSSDIGHDATAVLRLSHDKAMQENGNTVLTVEIAKNREGSSGDRVELAFWAGYATVGTMMEPA